jgi:hypothetical protein
VGNRGASALLRVPRVVDAREGGETALLVGFPDPGDCKEEGLPVRSQAFPQGRVATGVVGRGIGEWGSEESKKFNDYFHFLTFNCPSLPIYPSPMPLGYLSIDTVVKAVVTFVEGRV